MKLTLILTCLAAAISLPLPQEATRWRGIVPLRSTRAEAERVLGAWNTTCQCYSTETESVHVTYASGPCKGVLAGWNVPADTVLSLQVYPKNSILFSEMNVAKDEFVKTVDDAMYTHYGNGEKGLRYAVTGEGKLHSIWYGPSVKDNHLRCPGFPPTDGGITAYYPYYEFPYETVEDIKWRVGEFGIRLVKDREFKGYVIMYGTPDKKAEPITSLMTAVKNYLIDEINVNSNALEVINGGYRETPTVALFLIPREWPRPVATPTLGGINE